MLKGLTSRVNLTINNLHPDTLNYYNRLIGNGGIITDPDLRAVDAFVRSSYTNGLRVASGTQLIAQFCPYAGSNLAAALTNLWFPAGSKSINTTTTIAEANYSRTTGLTSAGGKSIGTGFNPSVQLAATSAGLGLYCRTNTGSAESSDIFAQVDANSIISLYLKWSTNDTFADAFNEATELSVVSASVLGWVCTSRVNTTHTLYVRGASITNNALSGGTIPNAEVFTALTNKSIGCYSIHRGLTAAQVTSLTNQVNTLMTAFGRNV